MGFNPNPVEPAKAFREDINGLRGVAIAAVLLFHLGSQQARGGFLGVDVFFVISGFLITEIVIRRLETGRFSLAAFWLARAQRLVPALWALIVVLAVFGWFMIDPITYQEIGTHAAASVLFISNIQYWREAGYFDKVAETKWLLHTWSLSIEWQFYLAYPIALMAAFRLSRRAGVSALIVSGLLISLGLSIGLALWRPSVAFYMLPARAWELLAGGLVATHLFRRELSDRASKGLEWTGLALIGLTVVLIRPDTPFQPVWAVPPVLGAALVLAARRTSLSVLNVRPIQFLGLRSYSVYLWHWPVIVAFRYYGWDAGAVAAPLEIALAISLGALSYTAIELPSRRGLRATPLLKTLAFATPACAAILAWSAADYRADGFAGRSPEPGLQSEYQAAKSDWDFPEQACSRLGSDHSIHSCRFGSAQETLVIGDSHANQWLPRAQMLNAPVRFITRDGCPPLPNIGISLGVDCPEFYRIAMQAAAEATYGRIIFVAYWRGYFRRSNSAGAVCVEYNNACISPDRRYDIMHDAFEAFAKDLRTLAPGKQIVLVLPDLEPSSDLPIELAKRSFLKRDLTDAEQTDFASIRIRTAEVRTALAGIAQEIGATTVDPLDTQCGSGTCTLVDGAGSPLYRDSNHLRSSVVRERAGFLDKFLVGPSPRCQSCQAKNGPNLP